MAYARHSSNNRRGRNNNRGGNSNRNNNNSGGGNRRPQVRINHVYDSNGPDGRVRGTAAQIVEKYENMARDAGASGNKVLQQSFLQHAEHYQRVLAEVQKEIDAQNERHTAQQKNKESDSNTDQKDDSETSQKTDKKSETPKAPKEADKMTDVPGFLAADETKKEKPAPKPRGRKPKEEKVDDKTEKVIEPA